MHQLTITVPGYIVDKISELIGLFGGEILKNEIVIAGLIFNAENPKLDNTTLKKLRINLKLSQPQMAAKLGMPPQQLSMYETGYRGITAKRSKMIIQTLSSEMDPSVGDQMRAELGIQSH